MTDKELRQLRRAELLEMLIAQSKKTEELQKMLDAANEKLNSRNITIQNAGSIAEAALQLNGVYESAQAASQQYLENVRRLTAEKEELCLQMETESRRKADLLLKDTINKCRAMEAETEQKCAEQVATAQREANAYWEEVSQKLEQFYDAHAGLRELLSIPNRGKIAQNPELSSVTP